MRYVRAGALRADVRPSPKEHDASSQGFSRGLWKLKNIFENAVSFSRDALTVFMCMWLFSSIGKDVCKWKVKRAEHDTQSRRRRGGPTDSHVVDQNQTQSGGLAPP